MTTRRWLVPMLLGAVACTAHCSADPPSSPSLAPSPAPPIVVDGSRACATIGAEGGTLAHASGAQVVVPPGALDAATTLCVSGASPPSSDLLRGSVPLTEMITVVPHDLTLRKAVDIVLPFDPARMPPGSTLDEVQLAMAPDAPTTFTRLVSVSDLATRMVRAKTIRFSGFIPVLSPNPVLITTAPQLPDATIDTPYAEALSAAGGAPPYAWSVSPSSVLPPGLTLAATGAIGGVPTVPSHYEIFLTVSDAAAHAVQAAFSLTALQATNPVPTLARVDPSAATQGAPTTTVSLTGESFAPNAQALWDGAPIATTFVSATQLAAAIPAASLRNVGAHAIAIFNPAPGGGTSASATFTVVPSVQNPIPTIVSVSPSTIAISTVDTQIAITGASFIPTSSAAIQNQGISTSYVSPTSLLATIPASYSSMAGTLRIAVYNPPPGGGFTASTVPVIVGDLDAVPTLASLSPSSIPAGSSAFTLVATGASFAADGQLFFGGTALSTTVLDANDATASVPAALVAQSGSAQVTFVNPAPGGGAAVPLRFEVTAPPDAGSDADAAGAVDGGTIEDATTTDASPADAAPATCTGVTVPPLPMYTSGDPAYVITATASCPGSPELRFFEQRIDGMSATWDPPSLVKDWSADNTYTITSGTAIYRLIVDVRTMGGAAVEATTTTNPSIAVDSINCYSGQPCSGLHCSGVAMNAYGCAFDSCDCDGSTAYRCQTGHFWCSLGGPSCGFGAPACPP